MTCYAHITEQNREKLDKKSSQVRINYIMHGYNGDYSHRHKATEDLVSCYSVLELRNVFLLSVSVL